MAMMTSLMGANKTATSRCRLSPLRLGTERDSAVDVIKGVACLLMVAAHVHFADAPWLRVATMAAVLFFASTGMNLVAIVERRRGQEKRLAFNALFLIFAGFADNYVQGTMKDCDVFQIAGLAMLTMLLLRYLLPRYWTWLFPLPFLIHVANQQFHWKVTATGISSFFLAPGLFPLLPWLSFYLLGAHLKKYGGKKPGWVIGAASAASLGILAFFVPFQFDKFWMSPDYFLIGCVAGSWSFASLRHCLTEDIAAKLTEIRLWGAHSLIFYILNNFMIRALEMLMPHGATLFFLSVILTALLLRPMIFLQTWASAQRPGMLLMAGATISLAVLAANHVLWPHLFYLRTLASFGLTFSFIACYPAWKNISRMAAKPTTKAVAPEYRIA